MGLIHGASDSQVHGSEARPTHNPQLFWWRRRQLRSQWQRRYMVLFIVLAFIHSYRHIVNYTWGVLLDGNVYIWHRDRAILLDVLTGHGRGSVNSVAWNPRNTQMFASCSDDFTIRLWEPLCNGAESSSTLGLAHRAAGEQNHESEPSGKGKGKSRESWIEDDPAARSP